MAQGRIAGKAQIIVAFLVAFSGLVASTALAQTPLDPRSLDDMFADVAERVPQFGGLTVDTKRTALVVHLTDQPDGIVAKLQQALREAISPSTLDGWPIDNIVVVKAEYGWLQLKSWREQFLNDLKNSGVSLLSTDIDEARNRLVFGVDDPNADSAPIEAALDRLEIPRDAVIIEREELAGVSAVDGSAPGESSWAWWFAGLGWLLFFLLLARTILVSRRRVPTPEFNQASVLDETKTRVR